MSGENSSVVVTRRRFLTVASASAGVLLLDACADGAVPTAQNTPTVASMVSPAAPAPVPTIAPGPPPMAPPAAPAAPAPNAPTAMGGMQGTPSMGVMPGAPASIAPAMTPASAGSPVMGTPRPSGTGAPTVGVPATGVPATGGTAMASGTPVSPTVGQLLVIRAAEYSFQTMGSIPGGVTTIRLQNTGKEPHNAQLARLNDGVTADQLIAALKSDLANNGNTAVALVTPAGGPNAVVGGGTVEVIQDLKASQYMALSTVVNAPGMSDAARGMVLPLTVTAPGPAVALPLVSDTITLANDDFNLPPLTTGRKLYQVVNAGAQPADFQIIGIATGKTLDDVKQYLAGSPAATAAGTPGATPSMPAPMAAASGPIPVTGGAGIATLAPGESGIAVLDLAAGEYAAWTGDPSTGIIQLTVT